MVKINEDLKIIKDKITNEELRKKSDKEV